jgi:small subunit ribosomal protein S18
VARNEELKTKGRVKNWKSGGKYTPKRRVCFFCTGKIASIDYKNVTVLGNYVSDRGKIEPRRRTGTCARHQRALAVAIKRARHLAMLPVASGHLNRLGEFSSLNYAVPEKAVAKQPEPETAPAAVQAEEEVKGS